MQLYSEFGQLNREHKTYKLLEKEQFYQTVREVNSKR
ncbi:Uncharacterised protein [Serratia fonticola]|nr:Uncharacterised protein [Serratia fonticola]CAI1788038.1 Uncharacterised protein [Serratia fonticola]CAI1852390.1 Uncharacterised protein [Serratia fonticola]